MKVLVFAPHNDDEVLGVGGTMAKLAKEGHEVFVCEVTAWLEKMERTKKLQEQAKEAHAILGVKESMFLDLPVVALKEMATYKKNNVFSKIVQDIKPNIVFIPHIGDIHVDHQETAISAMVALRPMDNPQLKGIYAYETLSETEWNIPNSANAFLPNTWSDISETLTLKLQAMKCFTWQIREYPHPRSIEAIQALAKLRGTTIGVNSAEAFFAIRQFL